MSDSAPGLYIHLPWCERKCPYCDFNSYEVRGAFDEQRYVAALLLDLELETDSSDTATIGSVFIGGGTPSLFSGAAMTSLLDGVRARVTLTADCEVTLEANPGSAEAGRFCDYRAAGVNRLSLGIQSFDDARLRALGRVHDAAEAMAAVASARHAGFGNLNLDLMFGLPGARSGDAVVDLQQAIDCAPAHISWYQLTIEAGTAFAHKPPSLPEHDAICDDYDAGLELLAAAGFEQYEISAHAQPGKASRHNLNYWRFGDYLGIGAGAHGKITRAGTVFRRHKPRHPLSYMKAVESGTGATEQARVEGARLLSEFMLNALRLRDGFSLGELVARTGLAANDARVEKPLSAACARGWLERDGEIVRPSAEGYRFLNDLQLLFID